MSAILQANNSLLSGRYAIYGEIASGGMASVLYGRLIGPAGFARPVAVKRLHPHIARDASVVSMFIDEARICARVSHANVVPILDVIETPGELSLVMEYVHGCTLETLLDMLRERGELTPLSIAGALILGVLHGLEAAHEAKSEQGEPLHIVHRDVSPQNVMLGVDGVPRLFDFGIAKARGRLRSTPSGEVKGKLSYMAPEQLGAGPMDARVDLYAASVVLWEILTGHMLFDGEHESTVVHQVLYGEVEGPRAYRTDVSDALNAIVLRGLARDPDTRFSSAREMARALERVLVPASQSEVSEWLNSFAGERLRGRAEWLREMQRAAELGVSAGATTERLSSGLGSERGPASSKPDSAQAQHASFMRTKRRPWLLVASIASLSAALAFALLWPRAKLDTQRRQQTEAAPARVEDVVAPPVTKPSSVEAVHAEDWSNDSPARAVEARPVEARGSAREQDNLEARGSARQQDNAEAQGSAREQDQDAPTLVDPSTPADASPVTNPSARSRSRGRHSSLAPGSARANESKPAVGAEKASDCREPYVIDALGVKRWKPACL
jgi:serine/threonine-protein kinase